MASKKFWETESWRQSPVKDVGLICHSEGGTKDQKMFEFQGMKPVWPWENNEGGLKD